jgi:hypothetical protein
MIVFRSTTEDQVWISLPFRVKRTERELTRTQARRLAVQYRRRGYLARVIKVGSMWATAAYKPRVNRPRRCDLIV